MFDAIAARYDTMNRLLSFGVDQGWRRKTVRALALTDGAQVLDVATGTADLAIQIATSSADGVRVVGLDPSEGMLEVGRSKVEAAGLDAVELVRGDAQQLPFGDDEFDGVSIAFGIRNVPDRLQGLKEMSRVTKPGGRVVILELNEPRGGIMGPLARFHIRKVVPWMGALLSGAKEYRYLQESVAAFPAPEEFASLMGQAGLEVIEVHQLTFGVCCLYVAEPSVGRVA
jgi:demethylmenaquinone methyltransferase/2-methoxy-6-polyprenyl-1,4-benzoquinol methylase